ncbi:hypothetical protein FH972_025718 [Carpinus fangiana]|uniref:Uncharacterized protein n=1 Tax=Carpinus fangiana TaxID=176857 RepID=A0A5N6L1U6_9ROSI|nr:hypothetical protein FH972_025718 [Carpinus fangiana]
MPKYINAFREVPKLLFRTNFGPRVQLRDRSLKSAGSFDLRTVAGRVIPKALDPSTYRGIFYYQEFFARSTLNF